MPLPPVPRVDYRASAAAAWAWPEHCSCTARLRKRPSSASASLWYSSANLQGGIGVNRECARAV